MYDVLIIGAGLSGIGAARYLQKKCPGKTWAILEARHALGGTWDLFRYPGVRSDSDMYTLGYGFKPWVQRKAMADGATILQYLLETAQETGVTEKIRFQHAVQTASWSSAEQYWTIAARNGVDDTMVQLQARFLYLCCGYYSYTQAHRPDFPGQSQFQGRLIHPQFWPADFDYAGKRVVVIGSGATAATLVPQLAKAACHVTMLQRSPTYMVSRPVEDALALWLNQHLPRQLAYDLCRFKNVLTGWFFYRLARNWPEQIKRRMIKMATDSLGEDASLAAHFVPSYKPWDQRICALPDGDLFEQIKAGRASVVTEQIDQITPSGIRLASGQELLADVIVTATGLKINILGDIAVTVDGAEFVPGDALTYKGIMLANLPNCAMTFGYINASWTLKADLTAAFVCRLLNFMDRKRYRVTVAHCDLPQGAESFLGFTSTYVQRALAILPKQGKRAPWRVNQNYFSDFVALRWGRIADGVLKFK
jgi:cyclohexanone monooxygenase